jgi:hypothetical protein
MSQKQVQRPQGELKGSNQGAADVKSTKPSVITEWRGRREDEFVRLQIENIAVWPRLYLRVCRVEDEILRPTGRAVPIPRDVIVELRAALVEAQIELNRHFEQLGRRLIDSNTR